MIARSGEVVWILDEGHLFAPALPPQEASKQLEAGVPTYSGILPGR